MSGFLSLCATKHAEHPSPCVQLQPLGHPGVWDIVFRNICLEASHLVLVVLYKVKFLHIVQVIISRCLLWFFMNLPTAQPKNIKERSKSSSYPLHLASVVEVVLVSTHLSVQPHHEGNLGLLNILEALDAEIIKFQNASKEVVFHVFTDLIVIYAICWWLLIFTEDCGVDNFLPFAVARRNHLDAGKLKCSPPLWMHTKYLADKTGM